MMSALITLDGPNGSGKTTLIEKLVPLLEERYSVIATKEPSNTDIGIYVRNKESSLCGKTYAHLIAADRCYHIETEIMPYLSKYDIVLCDRYVGSSMALQRYDGVEIEYIWKLNSDFIIPNLSIILISPPEELEKRISQRPFRSRFEKEMPHATENDYYRLAGNFLKEKGYNIFFVDNSEIRFDSNINIIYNEITKHTDEIK
jgi:dTMP kinase